MLLLDFSAAYDTVDHRLLLDLLNSRYGVRNGALAWLKSFLENRRQIVQLQSVASGEIVIQHGVPQGGILSPQLFQVYIRPLYDIIRAHGVLYHGYADDSQIYFTIDTSDIATIQKKVSLIPERKCVF